MVSGANWLLLTQSNTNDPLLSDSNVEAENDDKSSNQNQTNVCDGNQNLNSSAVLAAVTDAKLMKKAIKNLKNSFIDFMKENKKGEKSSGNIKDAETSEEIQDQVSFCRVLFPKNVLLTLSWHPLDNNIEARTWVTSLGARLQRKGQLNWWA